MTPGDLILILFFVLLIASMFTRGG